MSKKTYPSPPADEPTRRQVIAGVAIAFVGLAAGSVVWGNDKPNAAEAQSTGVEWLLTYLHQLGFRRGTALARVATRDTRGGRGL